MGVFCCQPVEAKADGENGRKLTSVSRGLALIDLVRRQVVDGLVVDVVARAQRQPGSSHERTGANSRDAHVRGAPIVQRPLDDVLRVLDQLRRRIVVVVGVEVPADDVIAERRHGGLAGGAARDVRRPHIRGVAPEDGQERLLVANHLVAPRCLGHGRQVGVRPRVRAELVSFVVHALD